MPVQSLNIEGLVAPAFTPMRPDGSLNLDAVAALADHAASHGLAGVFCGGTSGEGPSLSIVDRRQLLEQWVAAAAGRFPVIAHVGHAGVADAVLLAEHAEAAGAAAVAALPPFYFKPGDVTALADCCATIAAAAPSLPFYYYHIPSMTGVRLLMRAFVEVAVERVPTFAGLKFSDSDLADFGQCVAFLGHGFDLFYGRDEMLLPALAVGATAAIGTTYNLVAPLYQEIIRNWRDRNLGMAWSLYDRARDFVFRMDALGGLPAMKAAMAFVGIDCGPCRLPLRTLDERQRETLKRYLEGPSPLFEFRRPARSEGP